MGPQHSITSAAAALAVWKPKARRVMRRMFAFRPSTRPLLSPRRMAARIPSRWSRMVRPSLTNTGRRERCAQPHHPRTPRRDPRRHPPGTQQRPRGGTKRDHSPHHSSRFRFPHRQGCSGAGDAVLRPHHLAAASREVTTSATHTFFNGPGFADPDGSEDERAVAALDEPQGDQLAPQRPVVADRRVAVPRLQCHGLVEPGGRGAPRPPGSTRPVDLVGEDELEERGVAELARPGEREPLWQGVEGLAELEPAQQLAQLWRHRRGRRGGRGRHPATSWASPRSTANSSASRANRPAKTVTSGRGGSTDAEDLPAERTAYA